jgi:hypothetical protein
MGIKNFGVGGIDQKSNNLLRDKADLIDSRNMMANINNEYSKRPGTEEDIDFSDVYNDVIFIKSLNEYFFRSGADYISYKNGVRKEIPQTIIPSTTEDTSLMSGAEYLNTLIFTHILGQRGTFKYDGGSVYLAGLPTPTFSVNETGAALPAYVLGFFDFMDASGNQVFGPSSIVPVALEAYTTIDVNTLKDTGFYNGYIKISVSKTLSEATLADRTLTYTSKSSDIIVGSKVPFRCSNTGPLSSFITELDGYTIVGLDSYLMLEVESFTATEIVFKTDGFNGKSIALNVAGSTNCVGSMVFRYFFSESEVTGYTSGLRMIMDPTTLVSQSSGGGSINLTSPYLLSDIYDITTSKLRPPKCKYICTYGYQIAYGNVISFFDFDNKENFYTNNDLVMYSDLSTGDLGENLSESNRQLIGNTYDGEITGLTRVKDSLIVFKDRSAFSLDGALIPGQYTMRKIETNEIGCLSFKSILTTDTSVVFQGQDGLYSIDGYKAEKVTTKLDPFFRTIDTSLTRSVMNNDMDQYLFYTDLGIVVFDYEFKKWYIWDSIDASSGITVDNEAHIRFFSPTIVSKFNVAKNDSGVAINAYIRSAWLDSAEPGLLKKATFLRIYAFNNPGQNISLKYFLDWSEAKFKGPFLFDMDGETIKRNLDVIQNQSFSFEFRNNVIDEDLNISGYEVSAAVVQERDKNVK